MIPSISEPARYSSREPSAPESRLVRPVISPGCPPDAGARSGTYSGITLSPKAAWAWASTPS